MYKKNSSRIFLTVIIVIILVLTGVAYFIFINKNKINEKNITSSDKIPIQKINISKVIKNKKPKKISFEKFIKKSVKESRYLEIFHLKTGKKIIGYVVKMVGDLLVIKTKDKSFKIKESEIELRESFKEITNY